MPRIKLQASLSIVVATLFAMMVLLPSAANAASPVVKTVPWVASNPLIPHDTWAGKLITFKGTSDVQGSNIHYIWDFGDGTAPATGSVGDMYDVEATHAYASTFPTGTVFTARLTIQNTSTGETGDHAYYVEMRDKTLAVEVNVAIDEGLWELHRVQQRSTSGGVDYGSWSTWSGYWGVWAANVNAFEVNGHLESGDPLDPYTETVARGMRNIFTMLYGAAIAPQTLGNPDTNGNGLAVFVNQSYPFYQGGMIMDAIIASGTPTAIVPTGGANIVGRQYNAIVQDMVDGYLYCQYQDANYGGWRYNCHDFPDNSACQWAAIGMLAAERHSNPQTPALPASKDWGVTIPQFAKNANLNWLMYSQHPAGYFGYTDYNPVWGPFADTASGMVQLIFDGKGRGYVGPTTGASYHGWPTGWDYAETFLRNQWDNPGGYSYGPMKTSFYYALFSFTKSMLLHNPPIVNLHSATSGVPDLDWYSAELSKGAPSNGAARALVDGQTMPGGYWWYHDPNGNQYPFETAWAIIMLNQTLFEAGAPVAVAKATPNPAVANATVTLDGSGSYQQDASKSIVAWQWDFDNNGTFDATGVSVTHSWAAVGTYPVRLRVTDNSIPPKTADTIVNVVVSTPPIAPTANAGGPYFFCPGPNWYLDGRKSVNPDEGLHQPGNYPGDTIYPASSHFSWDLLGHGTFTDKTGDTPDVTGFFNPGTYVIQLKVCDTTATSFPSSGLGNLCSTASSQVTVKSSCPTCASIASIVARNKAVQLLWKDTGADHYNVYRSTVNGGPYTLIGSTNSRYSVYTDVTVNNGTTYYYVIREAQLNGNETCQSGQVWATPTGR